MAVKLIIFDLDGTLIDAAGDISAALNWALEPAGVDKFVRSEVTEMVGEGALALIGKALKKRGAHYDAKKFLDRFTGYYRTHPIVHTVLYPGVAETLAGLKAYGKAMVSNKFESVTLKILDALDLTQYFDMVVCADTIPERKPSPVPILHTISTLGLKPGEAILVGDSEIDVQAGKAALVKTVAVTYGYGKAGFEKEADFVIHRFDELTNILNEFSESPRP